jgi:hypothetical protein
VIRTALEEFLERAGVAPELAAPVKVTKAPTKVLEKAPLDWRGKYLCRSEMLTFARAALTPLFR